MHSRWREFLIIGGAAVLAVAVGWGLADESRGLAAVAAAALLLVGAEWARGPRPEALLVGLIVLGYIVGNRGFAQVAPVEGLPLFFGELGLAAGGTLVLLRGAFARTLPIRRDALNAAVLAWIVVGAARMPWDVQRHGLLAVRDFATIYYAGYFFIAQALAREERSRRWLEGCVTAGMALLPVVLLAFAAAPEFFFTTLTFRGVPLVYLKDDLAAAFLGAGVFVFWVRRTGPGGRAWLGGAAASLLLALTTGSPRAAMVGLGAVTLVWAVGARKGGPAVFQALVLAVAAALAFPLYAALGRDITQSAPYAVVERVISIGDMSGAHTYQNRESADAVDNNRFRLVWWGEIAAETWRDAPVLGLGFGHDLAEGFRREYYGAAYDEDFNARSPHSIVFTMLGRLGGVGLVTLGWLVLVIARRCWRAARRVARDDGVAAERALARWCVAGVLFVSACFGVVLEGPMGAVVFWTVLGLAHGSEVAEAEGAEAAGADVKPDATDRDRTVAAAALPNGAGSVS